MAESNRDSQFTLSEALEYQTCESLMDQEMDITDPTTEERAITLSNVFESLSEAQLRRAWNRWRIPK